MGPSPSPACQGSPLGLEIITAASRGRGSGLNENPSPAVALAQLPSLPSPVLAGSSLKRPKVS